MAEMLRMEKISKRFGSFYANRNVDLTVGEGEVHTLLGENGAGKSTLMNILVGLYQPTEGKIYFRGKEAKISSPGDAVALGIGMVHQHFMLVEAMTALENIVLGTKGASPKLDRAGDKKKIEELANKYGLEVDLDAKISEMSIGAQQRVEILKALYRGADLLVLDEPTAVLTDIEVEGLFDIIHSLTAEGKSVIFISHKMREVMHISDKITVLRSGESVQTLNCKDTTSQELADLMIGREFHESSYTKVTEPGDVVVELKDVSLNPEIKHGGLKNVNLTLHKGEILGIAGIDGNGQSQLAQVVTGLTAPTSGKVVGPNGGEIGLFSPQSFIDEGVADIPEDRNRMGLVGDMTIAENLVLKRTQEDRFSFGHGAWLKDDAIAEFAEEMRQKNDIRCSSVKQTARSLSGGNQQKVILARELEGDPSMLVAVYPTRGLDIGATNFVHDTMIRERDNGCAILLISADFDEVLKISDRIAVLFEGEIMGIYPGKDAPVKEISLAMAGK